MSHHLSNKGKIGMVFFRLPTSFSKGMSTYRYKSPDDQSKPFSLILPRNTMSMCKSLGEKHVQKLGSGMILLKNYLDLSEQVEIVNKCEELGVGPGGFYQPGFRSGAKLRLQMMCLGRNWDPQTKYDERFRSDGSEAPPIPDKFEKITINALEVSRSHLNSEDELPLMYPDICIDRDESSYSLRVGLPVVSISIGDSADFLYGHTRDLDNATKIVLDSGDVLIFGGESRHIFHGVKTIIPNSAPQPLLEQTMLRPGRLNLTFREY
ncbi:hypothetical protein OSB04_un000781 [Centaurea solstitialis]|uniref:Alpha-ketoglutarate-dependent dioxygenase AlkB-like domain-containing protein n=1 Tax=Centaurea solstitialis TaxID=347529 RepID=A0AA38S4F1_9ASTR|nr:hypothetical protein OSB04_un000781 [Centaurea solstitialis]